MNVIGLSPSNISDLMNWCGGILLLAIVACVIIFWIWQDYGGKK